MRKHFVDVRCRYLMSLTINTSQSQQSKHTSQNSYPGSHSWPFLRPDKWYTHRVNLKLMISLAFWSTFCENTRWKNNESIHEWFSKALESTFFPKSSSLDWEIVFELLHFNNSKLHRQIFRSETNAILQPLLLLASGNSYLTLCIFNTSRLWALDYTLTYSICKILAGGTTNWQLLKSAWIIFKIEEELLRCMIHLNYQVHIKKQQWLKNLIVLNLISHFYKSFVTR